VAAAKHAAESVTTMPPAGFRRNPAPIAFKSPCSSEFPHRQGQKRVKIPRFARPVARLTAEKMVYMRTIADFPIVRRNIALSTGSRSYALSG
jgi:hypothetical protein